MKEISNLKEPGQSQGLTPFRFSANPEVDPDSFVVYTAITGHYDSLKMQPKEATSRTDLVAFVDGEKPVRKTRWRCLSAERAFDDHYLNAKMHKILSHRSFPDKTYSLWLDGSVVINFTFPVEHLVSAYLADSDVAVLRHSRRTCIYQEAQAVLHKGLDDPKTILRQIERYTREGYPSNAGLAENCVILRRHTAAVQEFNEAWWEEILKGSRRDQLSFNYVAWKCGLKYSYFPGSIEWRVGLFRKFVHRGQSRQALVRLGAKCVGKVCDTLLSPVVLPIAAALTRQELRSAIKRIQLLGNAPFSEVSDGSAGATEMEPRSRSASQALHLDPGTVGSSKDVSVRRRSFSSPSGPKPTIAFGPERNYPSWNWVGYDTARELSKTCRMIVYNAAQPSPPDCDVLFIIKERPAAAFVAEAKYRGSRIVYCPIDFYESREQLDGDADFLRECDMVLVHCERQLPLVRRLCPSTYFIEHHGRYTLPEMADFKEEGFVLWIGGVQYLAHFLSWLELNPIESEVKILTDLGRMWTKRGARRYFTLSMRPDASTIAGCEIYRWSERKQLEMMRDCKAAIDVKQIEIFNQYYKPPTKAQKYVGSGIPLAVNPGSYAEEYFRTRGFPVASPEETDRWLSRRYWKQTRDFALELRASTSLEAVGRRYRNLIELIL